MKKFCGAKSAGVIGLHNNNIDADIDENDDNNDRDIDEPLLFMQCPRLTVASSTVFRAKRLLSKSRKRLPWSLNMLTASLLRYPSLKHGEYCHHRAFL